MPGESPERQGYDFSMRLSRIKKVSKKRDHREDES
jgi:hypothetical protein